MTTGASTANGDTPPGVLTRRDDAIVEIALNNPARLNAVSEEMYEALLDSLAVAESDSSCRAILVRGEGRTFCVGADLKTHGDAPRGLRERTAYVWLAQQVALRLQRSRLPVVVAVQGHAYGAGAEIALSADFLVIAEDARIAFPEVSIGTYVGGGVTRLLPRLVGLARARELLLLGTPLTGEAAVEMGLAHAAVPSAELLPAAREVARRLTALAPIPCTMMKRDLGESSADVLGTLAGEVEHLLACMATEDWAEGVAAFAEKRSPVFTGK